MEKIFSKFNSIRSGATLRKSIKNNLARIDSSNNQTRVIGYRQYLDGISKPKKALVSYLVQPVIEELSGIETALFSNSGAGRTIPKVLNEMGYIVDVINWDDTDPIGGEYDLVIYHGGKNFNEIKKLKTANNKLVYYSTGSYWEFHNIEENKRLEYFVKRHKHSLKLDREIKHSEEEANATADAIIVLGNKDAAKTYSKFTSVYNLEGASMPITNPRHIEELEDDKIGFLFLSGPGNLHKGLDIILDAWKKLPKNYQIHIITYLEDDFVEFYQKELYESANVHTHGYVPQRSKQFYDIISQCQYSILLSCSEGSPGSVIESMHQGLIPIISRASHVDLPKEGIVIDPVKVENVAEALAKLTQQNTNTTITKQSNVQSWADKTLKPTAYESNFADIIGKIV